MEFAKWYLEAHTGLRWKRKHLRIKTEKNFSEKLLCVLLIHLIELQLSPQVAILYDCSCGIFKEIFGGPWRAMVKKEISSVKNCKEIFWETAFCVLLIHLTELQLSPEETVHWDGSCGICKVLLGATRGLWRKRKYPKIKTERKLSEKLHCVLLIHLTELQLSAQEAFR